MITYYGTRGYTTIIYTENSKEYVHNKILSLLQDKQQLPLIVKYQRKPILETTLHELTVPTTATQYETIEDPQVFVNDMFIPLREYLLTKTHCLLLLTNQTVCLSCAKAHNCFQKYVRLAPESTIRKLRHNVRSAKEYLPKAAYYNADLARKAHLIDEYKIYHAKSADAFYSALYKAVCSQCFLHGPTKTSCLAIYHMCTKPYTVDEVKTRINQLIPPQIQTQILNWVYYTTTHKNTFANSAYKPTGLCRIINNRLYAEFQCSKRPWMFKYLNLDQCFAPIETQINYERNNAEDKCIDILAYLTAYNHVMRERQKAKSFNLPIKCAVIRTTVWKPYIYIAKRKTRTYDTCEIEPHMLHNMLLIIWMKKIHYK